MKTLKALTVGLIWASAAIIAISSPSRGVGADPLHLAASQLCEAIYMAEGGTKASVPYGILDGSCEGRDQCGYMCRETVKKTFRRWELSGSPKDFLVFLRDQYAPLNHHPLNRHWLRNVIHWYERS